MTCCLLFQQPQTLPPLPPPQPSKLTWSKSSQRTRRDWTHGQNCAAFSPFFCNSECQKCYIAGSKGSCPNKPVVLASDLCITLMKSCVKRDKLVLRCWCGTATRMIYRGFFSWLHKQHGEAVVGRVLVRERNAPTKEPLANWGNQVYVDKNIV